MLFTLLNWLLISVISIPFGMLLANKILGFEKPDIATCFFAGLFFLCLVCSLGNIFFPIDALFFFMLFAASFLCFIYLRKLKFEILSIHPLHWIIILPIGLSALFLSMGDILIVDEGSYFTQAVKWIENYPITKGIANLEERIGYNSNVFVIDALFRMRFLHQFGFNDLNGLALIFYSLFVFKKQATKIISFSYVNIFALLSLVYVFRKALSSFEPDLLNIIFGCIVLILFLEKHEKNALSTWDGSSSLIVIFSFLLITIKFSSLVYFLLPGYLIYNTRFAKNSLASISMGMVLVLIWLYKNVIISGYLLFPIHDIDLFNVEWKVALLEAEKYYAHISEYAKRGVDISDNLTKGSFFNLSWIKTWFNSELFIKILCASFITSMVLWFLGLKKDRKEIGIFTFLLFAILWWFFQYPSPRIAWPLIICFIAGGIYSCFKVISFQKFTFRIMSGIWVLLIISSFHHFSKSIPENFDDLVYPSQSTEIIEKYQEYCWDKNLPCESTGAPIYMIGKEIEHGFKAEH